MKRLLNSSDRSRKREELSVLSPGQFVKALRTLRSTIQVKSDIYNRRSFRRVGDVHRSWSNRSTPFIKKLYAAITAGIRTFFDAEPRLQSTCTHGPDNERTSLPFFRPEEQIRRQCPVEIVHGECNWFAVSLYYKPAVRHHTTAFLSDAFIVCCFGPGSPCGVQSSSRRECMHLGSYDNTFVAG